MGGRAEREPFPLDDREVWITEVSDARLSKYERMLRSAAAGVRLDGSSRAAGGQYFHDLIQREIARRASSLF